MRVLAFITFVIALPVGTFAQTADNPWFVRTGLMSGAILPTNPFALGASPGHVDWGSSVTLEIGRRTDGTSAWHEIYNRPEYGVGFSVAPFLSGARPVQAREAYGFFSWPFATIANGLDVTTDFGLGLSWGWQPVLGSNLNARIDWGFYLRSTLTPRAMLFAGLDFTHRSNGGLVQPNIGINVLGPKVMMQYDFAASHDGDRRGDAPRHAERSGSCPCGTMFVLSAAGGAKNVIETASPIVRHDVGAFDGTLGFERRFYMFGRFVGGVTAMYDGSSLSQWSAGTYGGYEHIISRFAAGVHVGYKVLSGVSDGQSTRLYERYVLSYAISGRVFSTLAIRATDGRKADALEAGIGYRISGR